MIPYYMLPALEIGPLHINAYGVMFALGVLVASLLAVREARKRNINADVIWDLVLYLLLGVIIGSRLFYVLFYWPKDVPMTFFGALSIWNGGMAFFGGFFGALVAGYVYLRKHKLGFLEYADIFALPVVVGHAFGRVGDYLTGGHPGRIADLPWAIYFEGAFRHPIVLYEIIGLVIIAIILFNIRKLRLFNGFIFSSYVMLYSIQRMFLDFFRLESTDPRYLGLTPSQYVVIILFVLSAVFIIVNIRIKNKIR